MAVVDEEMTAKVDAFVRFVQFFKTKKKKKEKGFDQYLYVGLAGFQIRFYYCRNSEAARRRALYNAFPKCPRDDFFSRAYSANIELTVRHYASRTACAHFDTGYGFKLNDVERTLRSSAFTTEESAFFRVPS